jgi:hypothetical protein
LSLFNIEQATLAESVTRNVPCLFPAIRSIDLSSNPQLSGVLPVGSTSYPNLQQVSMQSHRALTSHVSKTEANIWFGCLTPSIVSAFVLPSAQLDVSGTAATGAIPDSWRSFGALQRLAMQDTRLQCPLVVDDRNQVREQTATRRKQC